MSDLIREEVPLQKRTKQSIVKTVQQIVSQSNVVRIEIDARDILVRFWRVGTEEEKKERHRSFGDILRNVEMEELEYDPDKNRTPTMALLEAFDVLSDAAVYPSYVVSGFGPQKLRSLFPISRRSSTLYGVPLVYLDRQDDDEVIYLCGADIRNAEPLDLSYAVRVPLS